MKTILLSLALAAPSFAIGIHPGWYYLELQTPQGIVDSAPAPYGDWFSPGYPTYGEIGYLIYTAVPQGIVQGWELLPCPVAVDCPVAHVTQGSHGAPAVPEPTTMAMIGMGLVAVWVGRRRG